MNTIYKTSAFVMVFVFCLAIASVALANQAPIANAGPDLYVNSNQTIVLQGSGSDSDGNSLTYYWNCSGGTLSSYSVAQPTYTAPIINQYNNQATYVCTLTVTDSTSLSAFDSMTVFANYNQTGSTLLVSKKVINLTSGNLNWSTSVSAAPSNILSFAITLQATGNQDVHNVYVRDVLPTNLVYKGNMMVNANLNYGGDSISGINIGTIPAGGITVIAYQVQVAGYNSLPFGASVLTNSATITSNESGSQIVSSSVFVNNSAIYGATDVATGLTNNFMTESFFLPMFLIVLGSWFYFSGRVYKFADWLGARI